MSKFKDTLFEDYNLEGTEIPEAEIPKVIHRIWVGGKIEAATLENLKLFQCALNYAQGDRDEKYEHILWTTKSTQRNEEFKKQMDELQGMGMKICFMDENFDQSNIGRATKKEIENLMQGNKYKFVSDLWRMYILYVMGGIYMDADIGIGQETFEGTLYHRYQSKEDKYSYMPLLGSAFPFFNDNLKLKEKDLGGYFEKEAGGYKSYGWNYFYATVAENNAILKALLGLLEGKDAQTVALEMISSFYADIRQENSEELFKCAFAPLDLQYITKASTIKK